jgi:SEC-C motif
MMEPRRNTLCSCGSGKRFKHCHGRLESLLNNTGTAERVSMKRTQALSSGLIIQQDFSDAVRAVFFQTDYDDEFFYATNGGTLFLVSFGGRVYGLTCKHVIRDFEPGKLFITQEKYATKGSKPAPIVGLALPSAPTGEAAGTDVEDICAVEFAGDIAPDFFKCTPYIIDEKTVCTSKVGHELHVVGVLKSKTQIIPPDITMGFCHLVLHDTGVSSSDPFLRQAKGVFFYPAFDNIIGLSGSPVFDQTTNALCGMVNRGGMAGSICTIHYLDISDIVKILEALRTHAASASYAKIITP